MNNNYQPHAPRRIVDFGNSELYDLQWDAAGNLGQVNRAVIDGHTQDSRFLFWTEDNLMHTAVDQDYYSYYAYDYAGERTLKLVGRNNEMDVNAEFQHTAAVLDHPTLYPSPYVVLGLHGYTKHYYAGTERICAKIGGGFNAHFSEERPDLQETANTLFAQSRDDIHQRELPQNDLNCVVSYGHVPDDELNAPLYDMPNHLYADAEIDLEWFHHVVERCEHETEEDKVFFYHSDHLGSASWITNKTGDAIQHLQYLPFGAPFVNQYAPGAGYQERFTFTGKERDEETGYGYFGARYMDHELMTMWLSVDPMADKYPNISPYAYCIWNPIVLIDPDGNEGIVVSGGEYDGDRYKYNFIEPAITKLKALKAAAGNEPITWVVMTAGYSESDMASFQKIARDLGVGFQAISSADEFTNYLNAKSIGSAELSEARRNDPITSISVFGHGYAGSAEFAHNQPGQGRFSWGTGNVKQLDAGAFKNATVDFYTCNSATDPEKGKSLGYVFSQQTGAVVTGYRGKSTYAKMNVGEGIGAKWDRLWEGFNPNGSVRLPQAGEGAIRIKFLPPVMNGNQ